MSTETQPAKRKVLVVDDEPQNLQLVGENLRRANIPFLFAINGDEALTVVREEQPALILLDVMMPGKDGFEVCNILKADPETAHIPVIFLTAASSTSDLVSGFASGAVDYIRKPFIREELLARVKTQLQLQAAHTELNRLAQQRSELLTRLAHDIKNPSSGIVGLIRLMREDIADGNQPDAEAHSILDLIESCAKGMGELVNGILDEAQSSQADQPTTLSTAIDIREVLEHLIQLNTVHAQPRNIRFEFKALEQSTVSMSRRILNEIFDNLLSNAVKYSRAGSCIEVRITSSLAIPKGFRVEIADGAQPLEPQVMERLFKPFVRGKNQSETAQTSHGIGLSVVKRLVNFHNGRVGVETRSDGKGNVFFIELPEGTATNSHG